ncbi:MAG: redox-sensing transcriptional repressor Rex [Clostridiales bacterium]|nr:MAG: redox-sensing transcriptional repressor Rex [Clostridiales bacterium]
MDGQPISKQALQRLPVYLNYLKSLPDNDPVNISATAIAEALHLHDVQVRKDLAIVSTGGRPKIGYVTKDLIADLQRYLGYDNVENAVVVGAGNLGRALLSYDGFGAYGLNIVAAFDCDEALAGQTIRGKEIFSVAKLEDLCERLKIRIGIITAPAGAAQQLCDRLIRGGVLAIWNFAPVHLNVPEGVLVQNENMAASLALLSKHLSEKMCG